MNVSPAPHASAFRTWLHGPLLDLREGEAYTPYGRGLDVARRVLRNADPLPIAVDVYAIHPPSFRRRVVERCGTPDHAVADPRDVPDPSESGGPASPDLASLRALLDDEPALAPGDRLRLVWMLNRLLFHDLVLDLVPEPTPERVSASDEAAQMAFLRTLSAFGRSIDRPGAFDPSAFAMIAEHASHGPTRVNALYRTVSLTVRERDDVDAASRWQKAHRAAIEDLEPDLPAHTRHAFWSRYFRVHGFLPQLQQDADAMTDAMEQAEAHAEKMQRETHRQRAEADGIWYAMLESRTKEALVRGDLDVAVERARRLTRGAPTDARAHLHLGQVSVERQEYRAAIDAYRKAARLAPAGGEIANDMMGQCYEAVGEPDQAVDAYMRALAIDPLVVSSVRSLLDLPDAAGPVVTAWARRHARWLTETHSVEIDVPVPQETKPFRRYDGTLG